MSLLFAVGMLQNPLPHPNPHFCLWSFPTNGPRSTFLYLLYWCCGCWPCPKKESSCTSTNTAIYIKAHSLALAPHAQVVKVEARACRMFDICRWRSWSYRRLFEDEDELWVGQSEFDGNDNNNNNNSNINKD